MERVNKNDKKWMNAPFLLASWIARSMAGKLPDKEQRLLDDWRRASDRNSQLYDRIASREGEEMKRKRFKAFDKVSGWQGVSEKLVGIEVKVNRWRGFLRYAVILFLLLGGVGWWQLHMDRKGKLTSLERMDVIVPGGARAELVLHTGKIVNLGIESGLIQSSKNVIINNKKNILSFQGVGEEKQFDSLKYNEVIVPAGGEYQLVLCDGTIVYLNSMTKIRFPERFMENIREVEIEGEAFFEVTKNDHVPFVVKTRVYDITVLGTKFNVMTYSDDSVVNTTLVEGKVAVSGKCIEGTRVLLPNEQLELNYKSGIMNVRMVDVTYSTAWKDGLFRFRDERLEEIMRVLERWYDVTVKYEDESLKNLCFGFNMGRHETIDPLLQIFELNGKVKIVKEGKVLRVRRGR